MEQLAWILQPSNRASRWRLVLRQYQVSLRRSGRDQYRGLCPIHRGAGPGSLSRQPEPEHLSLFFLRRRRHACWTSSWPWKDARCGKPRASCSIGRHASQRRARRCPGKTTGYEKNYTAVAAWIHAAQHR